MKALLQRVRTAKVEVDQKVIGSIDQGILLFLGVEKEDSEATVDKLVEKTLNYRIFSDEDDKLNLSLLDIKGQLLVVSQFTLAANTTKGRRPGFDTAAPPELGKALYDQFVVECRMKGVKVATGQFGANMQISLVNDGPVTFLLEG